jgi:epoxyqueuosine reductase
LDASRCISYLTIEHKGHIPEEFRTAMGNRIYGCDDCLAVCPWNKFAQTASEAAFVPRADLDLPLLTTLLDLDDVAFRTHFSGSPVKRIGRDRFLRNVLIAFGNAEATVVPPALEALLLDASALVRAMAVWAIQRIAPPDQLAVLRATFEPREVDEDVRREWRPIGDCWQR